MGLDITWAVDWVRRSADVIAEHRVELITLDREIGDGDHGENMDRGFQAVLPKLDDLPAGSTPGDVLKLVATTLISTVGGAAGPLYGTAYLKGAVAAGSGPYYGYGPGYGYDYGPDYGYDYAPGPVVVERSGGAEAYCEQRFRSYDPASGTYLGYDGMRHPCP